jgi:hypothetical protein
MDSHLPQSPALQSIVLSRVYESGLLKEAIQHACAAAGWTDVKLSEIFEAIWPAGPQPSEGDEPKKPAGRKKGKTEGKEAKPRPLTPYNLFLTLCLDYIDKHKDSPAFQVSRRLPCVADCPLQQH